MSDRLIEADAGGHPVIAGTHVTVEEVLKELATCEEAYRPILHAHPELKREGIQAALVFAAEKMHATPDRPAMDFARALGEFEPQTPLAKKLWERRKAVIQEAIARGEPLLESWDAVNQEVRERRGERIIENGL